jgi:hypothetical protein
MEAMALMAGMLMVSMSLQYRTYQKIKVRK